MTFTATESYRIAVPKTVDGNGIAEAIACELEALGHRPEFFPLEARVPDGVEVVFLFGPFGKFLHVPQQFALNGSGRGAGNRRRPTFVYWNTEGLPDPRLPRPLVDSLSVARSWAGRLSHHPNPRLRHLAARGPLAQLERRLLRFRYLGDYLYALRQGWVDVFADISAYYAGLLRGRGLPALVAPFGSFAGWYEELNLERDIDVLWMGKRASQRRSDALDRLRAELREHGVEIHMVDNEERPFVFGDERTRLLNRTKITLNLLRTWYDENSLRICMAAPNRSLVVSEPLLPHVPQYQAGVHYIAAPLAGLAQTILYYLENEAERRRIVENAYAVSTQEVTFRNSMRTIMDAVREKRA